MTYRSRSFLGVVFAAAIASACSSSSSSGPAASNDAAADDGGIPIVDAAPAAVCDAVSLAPAVDAGAAACFECQAAHCMSEIAACSTDCTCAPAYGCLERNSTGDSLNSGYSACTVAVDAVTNGNDALTAVTQCATINCSPQCFPDSG